MFNYFKFLELLKRDIFKPPDKCLLDSILYANQFSDLDFKSLDVDELEECIYQAGVREDLIISFISELKDVPRCIFALDFF